MTEIQEYPVVVVGGGPVGLTTSLLLSRLGVEHAVFERHPSTSIHPKAVGLNQRTIEIFRALGIEEEVRAAAAPPRTVSRTAWYTSFDGPTALHGRRIAVRDAWGGGRYAEEYAAMSPSSYTVLPQIRLEPVLRRAAEAQAPAHVFFGAPVARIEQDDDGVTVTVADGGDGAERRVRARYLVGADGGRFVADELGIAMAGESNLVDMVSAHFSADLRGLLPDDSCLINWFVNPDLGGSIGSGYLYHLGPWDEEEQSEEWVFACGFGPDDPDRFDEDGMKKRILRSLGVETLDAELHSISHWYINSVVAETFRNGRCFLVGDAAHRIPPWGALGLNTGIQDAHNLAWKIAATLDSEELEPLLDTYELERRPIATTVAANSLHNFRNHGGLVDAAIGLDPTTPPEEGWAALADLWSGSETGRRRQAALDEAIAFMDQEFHAHGVECGFAYPVGAVAGESETSSLPSDPLVYRPTTAPGHHVPHVWLDGRDRRISTLDLAAPGRLVLIVDAAAEEWRRALGASASPLADLVDVVEVGEGHPLTDAEGRWAQLREVDSDGAVLVRPDTVVAWRSLGLPADPATALQSALSTVLASSAVVPSAGDEPELSVAR
ncbi:FAD-dependent monooxygenase [Georgenia sp. SUBG003]|uniref:FAD-dependent monooxygenase n=1 Tax=Georgenia sp. SUBG003 TaxID=1497974 RepID=UPI000693DA6E